MDSYYNNIAHYRTTSCGLKMAANVFPPLPSRGWIYSLALWDALTKTKAKELGKPHGIASVRAFRDLQGEICKCALLGAKRSVWEPVAMLLGAHAWRTATWRTPRQLDRWPDHCGTLRPVKLPFKRGGEHRPQVLTHTRGELIDIWMTKE